MSQEHVTASPQGNDNPPTTDQGERPLSPNAPVTGTGQQSRQTTPENRSPSHVEVGAEATGDSSPQVNGNSNENNGDKDPPEIEKPAEEPILSSKEPLDDYSWGDLEQRFGTRMEECTKSEEALGQEFNELLKVRLSKVTLFKKL